jgi:hypothetical protein
VKPELRVNRADKNGKGLELTSYPITLSEMNITGTLPPMGNLKPNLKGHDINTWNWLQEKDRQFI